MVADAAVTERPCDRFRRYLLTEIASYEIVLVTLGPLELTRKKLAIAKEMLDYFDAVEMKEAKARTRRS